MSFDTNSTKRFKDQYYESIVSQHNEDNLFEDHEFPASDQSLYFTKMPPQGIRWMRPKEARQNPQFVVDGFDRCDMDQGYIGNCWFIAGAVGIMQSPKLFARIVPEDQSFEDNYAGIFRFRFWLYGEWVEVVVDDRLPYWPDGNLVFCSNKQQPDEYWGSLLEKAYAKLYGSYENLEAGQTYDALIDMSGGIQEQFDLKKLDSNIRSKFWQILIQGFNKGSLLGCSINADPSIKEARLSNGLVRGHAYTITMMCELNGENLIRIRNPWGNETEWKGPCSREWDSVSENDKEEIGFTKSKDGEFWMNFSDFMSNWDNVQICHLSADSFSSELLENDDDSDLKWKCSTYQASWQRGVTAGGCGQSNQIKFWSNPQFLITLNDVDKDDDENLSSVIISLMQKDSRLKRLKTRSEDSAEEFIQFRLFRVHDDVDVEEAKTNGVKLYANQLDRIGTSGSYINSREITKRFRVQPGHYLIIPSTYDEDKNCEFMLRVFTEQPIDSNHLPSDKEDLNDDDIYVEPSSEDQKVHWTQILNPKVFKDMKKVTKILLSDEVQSFFRSNFEKAGFSQHLNNPFAQQAGAFFNEHANRYIKGEYDDLISGVKSSFGKFFKK